VNQPTNQQIMDEIIAMKSLLIELLEHTNGNKQLDKRLERVRDMLKTPESMKNE
jgi:allophanate hydrolase subunit 1